MMRKGATFSAGDRYGTLKPDLQYQVVLLDGSDFIVEVNKKSLGQTVFDQVLRRLAVLDRDYFGLQHEDEQKTQQWLDLSKPVKKQIKKGGQLHFRARFYPADPMVLHPSSRTQFYLQLRQDISRGRLLCPPHSAPCTLSYILQADLGDYENEERDAEYLTEQCLVSPQSQGLESEAAKYHQLHRGMSPKDAVSKFLREVRKLEFYGILLFYIKYEDKQYQVGLSPAGVTILKGTKRYIHFEWSKILQVSYKNKKFTMKVHREEEPQGGKRPAKVVNHLTFELDSMRCCKELWKSFVNSIAFYSDHPTKRIEDDPPGESQRSPGAPAPISSSEGRTYIFPTTTDLGNQPTVEFHDSESESRGSKQSKLDKVRKAQSLPRKLPGQDPIALALMHHGNGEGRQRSQFSDPYSPASPDDSSSSTTSDSSPVAGSHRFPPSNEGVLHGQQVMVENGHYSPYKYSREPESQTSSSSALVPSRTSNQEGLSQDHEDMHDSLLDLADELGGSAESDEEESPPVKQRTASTHSQPVGIRQNSAVRVPSPHLVPNAHFSPLPQQAGSPPSKPPRTAQTTFRPANMVSPVPSGEELGGKQNTKQNRRLVRHWVQEQMRSSRQSLESSGSQERAASQRSGAASSPLGAQRSTISVERSNSSQMHGEGLSQSTRSDASVHSLQHSRASPQMPSVRYTQSGGTRTTEEIPLPVSKPEHDYPLPDSPAPPPYMSPSPDSEQALLLQRRQQQQQLIPMTIDGPDLSSVDEILMSHTKKQGSATTSTATSSNHQSAASSPSTQPNSQLHSNSPGQQKRQRSRGEVLLRTKVKEIEEVMVERHSLEIETSELPSQMTVSLSPQIPSPENTGAPASNVLPVSKVDASVEARHQRRGRERHLHQSQKRLNKMLKGEGHSVPTQQPSEADLTGSPPAPMLDEFPPGIDLEDFAQEKIEIDPRNLINAPSPVYDKLVEEMSNDEHSTTASGHHPGISQPPLDVTPQSTGATMPTANRFMPKDILHEVMATDNLPPPPPHLLALTEELEGQTTVSFNEPRTFPPRLPSHTTNTTVPSTATGYPEKKKPFDPKFFVRSFERERERASTVADTSRYPPEIASFMTRVRPSSMDATTPDSRLSPDMIDQKTEATEMRMDRWYQPERGMDRQDQTEMRMDRRDHPERRMDSRVQRMDGRDHPERRMDSRVQRMDGRDQPERRMDSRVQRMEGRDHPERRMDSRVQRMDGRDQPERRMDRRVQRMDGRDQPERRMDSRVQRMEGRDQPVDVTERRMDSRHQTANVTERKSDRQNQPVEITERRMDRRDDMAPKLHSSSQGQRIYSLRESSIQRHRSNEFTRHVPRQQAVHHREASLPENGVFSHSHPDFTQSWESSPRMATARGGQSISLPRGQSAGLSYYRHDSSRESTPLTANSDGLPPTMNPRDHNHSDVRRVQTFTAGRAFQQHQRYSPSPLSYEEDSIPNSPTYFTHHHPSWERATPSPNTEALNRSFQEHLNSLEGHRKGRQHRVLDWMQRTSNDWANRPMIRDPEANIPTKPYQRQCHLYETAEDAFRSETHPPQQAQTGRPFYKYPSYSSNDLGQTRGQAQRRGYPTAKIEKDFYIIDV